MSGSELTRQSVPSLPRGVRLKHDDVRDRTILVAPERTLVLDGPGIAIMELVDGENSIEVIAERLAEKFDAPLKTIGNDVVAFLRDLINRGYLDIRNDGG
ncbi:MAG: pyrroloquinoline quinone biosynthesis peptide chaperone PqqD [Pseudomonadota bacterium]